MLDFRRSLIHRNSIVGLGKLQEWWHTEDDYIEYNYSEVEDLEEFEKQLGWLMSLGADGFIEVEAEYGDIIKYELISNRQVNCYAGTVLFQFNGVIAEADSCGVGVGEK